MAGKKLRSVIEKARQAISTHRRGPGVSVGLLVAGLLSGVPGLIALGMAVFGRSADPLPFAVGLLLLAALVFGGLFWYRHATPVEVRVYPFGIKWRARGRTFEYDWEEVEEVYRSEVITVTEGGRSRDASLELHFEDGARLKCTNSLMKYDELASFVMATTANTLMTKARKRLRDGVPFGPVELSDEGVTVEDEHYSWAELRQTRVRNGNVIFYFPKKRKYEYPLSEVPNYLVLFGLLEEQGKGGIIDQRPDQD